MIDTAISASKDAWHNPFPRSEDEGFLMSVYEVRQMETGGSVRIIIIFFANSTKMPTFALPFTKPR